MESTIKRRKRKRQGKNSNRGRVITGAKGMRKTWRKMEINGKRGKSRDDVVNGLVNDGEGRKIGGG